jgi:ribose transport system permease protein
VTIKFLRKSNIGDRLGMAISLLVMVATFSLLNENYFQLANFQSILISASLMGLVAVGESFLIIAGHIDLSPGSISALSGVLVAVLLASGIPALPALLLVVLVGIGIGYLNAALVTKLRLEPFIATLATMSIIRGAAFIVNNGKPSPISNELYLSFGVFPILGLPPPVWLLIVVMAVFTVILSRTSFGRNVYIVGGNPTAARLAGINSNKLVTKLYMITAGLSALGGAMLASRMNVGHPAASNGLEFDAVTAAILGGIAFTGGVGNLTGTVLGILVLQGFNNGLLLMNVPSFWQYVARGALLIVALSFDFIRNRRRGRA